MKVLMITSEAVPFIKTGGLADVVTALSRSLLSLGHDVKIILPYYADCVLDEAELLPWNISISLGIETEHIRIHSLHMQNLECLFLDSPYFSERKGVYGETPHEPYPDNLYRYTLFNYAIFEICRHINWYPDIFHCHDWTTGFVPMLLKKQKSRFFRQAKSLMTIHNLGYQGDYAKHDIQLTGLSASDLFPSDFHYSHRINMLKTGITDADAITTVSRTYAQEIQTKSMGHGLDQLLKERSDSLFGILNGVDYTEWNPEDDEYIPHRYSTESLDRKRLNKQALQEYCGLPKDDTIPVIGMVSRIADQKGFRELCSGSPSALERILVELPVQIVIVGTGDQEIESYLSRLSDMYDNFSAQIVFNNYIAHLVEAGSDFFLMPSRYEPCGLNQIYSLKYGTFPIVRNTGGLADTIDPMDETYRHGEGFAFDEMSGEAIYDAVKQALDLWQQPSDIIESARKRAMRKHFSWDHAAREYVKVYNRLCNKGRIS